MSAANESKATVDPKDPHKEAAEVIGVARVLADKAGRVAGEFAAWVDSLPLDDPQKVVLVQVAKSLSASASGLAQALRHD